MLEGRVLPVGSAGGERVPTETTRHAPYTEIALKPRRSCWRSAIRSSPFWLLGRPRADRVVMKRVTFGEINARSRVWRPSG
jgi:hypothetical protein